MLDDSGDKQAPEKNLVSSRRGFPHSILLFCLRRMSQVMNSLTSTSGEPLTSLQKQSTAEPISANCGAYSVKLPHISILGKITCCGHKSLLLT